VLGHLLCFMQTCSPLAGTSFVPSCSLLCSCDFGLCEDWEWGGGFVSTASVTLNSDDFVLRGCLALPWCLVSTTFTSPSGLRCIILDGAATPAAAIFAPLNNNYHHCSPVCVCVIYRLFIITIISNRTCKVPLTGTQQCHTTKWTKNEHENV